MPNKKTKQITPSQRSPAVLPHCKIWVEIDGEVLLSAWRIDLLEAVDNTGSLARAARQLKVPYRTAWYKLHAIERQLGTKLIATQSGGKQGGGSQLTQEARQLIEHFHRVSAGVSELVEQRFRNEFGHLFPLLQRSAGRFPVS